MKDVPLILYSTLLLHHLIAGLLSEVWACHSHHTSDYINKYCAYRFRFLTIWNLILQITYLQLSILNRILSRLELDSTGRFQIKIASILRYLNLSLLSPLSFYSFLVFWMIYSIDRELIFPSEIDEVLPRWTNHSVHSVVILLPIMEMLLQRKPDLPSFESTFLGVTAFISNYGIVLHGTHYFDSVWLYKFYNAIPRQGILTFHVISYVVLISLLALVREVHTMLGRKSKIS